MKFENIELINRLGIFFFYDKDGIVDDYVVKMLEEYEPFFSELLTVVNGELTIEGKIKLESIKNNRVIVRENKGFDVWAYRTGLFELGWDKVRKADELIMFNFTVIGPVDSFKPMFSTMDARDVDFWGITIHNGADFDPFNVMKDHRIPIHIQSHFIAVRNTILRSKEYFDYWNDRPMINHYEEAVGYHEAIFTKYFEEKGYTWDVYVDTWDLVEKTYYPLFNMPVDLIKNRKCPIFKRKIFIQEYGDTIEENAFEKAKALYEYLKYETNYDTRLLDVHLLRSVGQSQFITGTNLHFIIEEKEPIESINKMCLISRQKYDSLSKIQQNLLEDHFDRVDIIDEQSWTDELITRLLQINQDEYEFVLVLDKVSRKKKYGFNLTDTVFSSRDNLIDSSLFGDKNYCNGIVECFKKNESLAMLIPPSSLHSFYFTDTVEEERKIYKTIIKKTMNEWNIDCKVNENDFQLFPRDNCFWIRTSVIQNIKKELYSLLGTKKTKYYYLFLPYLLQKNSSYITWCTSKRTAENLMTVMYKIVDRINAKVLYQHRGLLDIERNLNYEQIDNTVCEIHYDIGNGFNKKDMQYAYYEQFKGHKRVKFKLPSNVKKVRFDPIEKSACICKNLKIINKEIYARPYNGYRVDTCDFFFYSDPQYVLVGNFEDTNELIIEVENIYGFKLDKNVEDKLYYRYRLIDSINNKINYEPTGLTNICNMLRLDGVASTVAEIHYDIGNGFNIDDMEYVYYEEDVHCKKISFEVPEGTRYVRYDPIEKTACMCYGVKCNAGMFVTPINGYRIGKMDVFFTTDPQYLIEGEFEKNKNIQIEIKSLQEFALDDETEKLMVGRFRNIDIANNKMNYSATGILNMANQLRCECLYGIMCEAHFDTGNGFNTEEMAYSYYIEGGNIKKVEFIVPPNTKNIRFDPIENSSCVCSGIRVNSERINIRPYNGYSVGNMDIFLNNDPQYIISGDFFGIEKMEIEFESLQGFVISEEEEKELIARYEKLKKFDEEVTKQSGVVKISNQLLDRADDVFEICYDFGNGFEVDRIKDYLVNSDAGLIARIPVPKEAIRVELILSNLNACTCYGVSADEKALSVLPKNGYRFNEMDVFFDNPPRYIINVARNTYQEIIISFDKIETLVFDQKILEDDKLRIVLQNELIQTNAKKTCEIYYDLGKGFNEKQKTYNCYEIEEGKYKINITK